MSQRGGWGPFLRVGPLLPVGLLPGCPPKFPPVHSGGAGGIPGRTSLGLSPSSGQCVLCKLFPSSLTGPCLVFPAPGSPSVPGWVFPLCGHPAVRPVHLLDSFFLDFPLPSVTFPPRSGKSGQSPVLLGDYSSPLTALQSQG